MPRNAVAAAPTAISIAAVRNADVSASPKMLPFVNVNRWPLSASQPDTEAPSSSRNAVARPRPERVFCRDLRVEVIS